jgi:hypothetical protein
LVAASWAFCAPLRRCLASSLAARACLQLLAAGLLGPLILSPMGTSWGLVFRDCLNLVHCFAGPFREKFEHPRLQGCKKTGSALVETFRTGTRLSIIWLAVPSCQTGGSSSSGNGGQWLLQPLSSTFYCQHHFATKLSRQSRPQFVCARCE